jgi:nicotinate dehydrogenase subunit A
MAVNIKVNGAVHSVPAEPDTPLLYVLRNDLGLSAAKFGCGLGQCGSCTVLVDGAPVRSCIVPIGTLGQSEITTLEGIGTLEQPHPLQAAFIEEQAAQCGYCIPGMIMMAKALLDRKQQLSEDEVRLALASNLCRCGTHNRIVRAILKVAQPGGRI